MSHSHLSLRTPQEKNIYANFRHLADRHGDWKVWSDFVQLSACSLCLSDRTRRMSEYDAIAKYYTEAELNQFAEMLRETTTALDINPAQDFLGTLYMALGLGNVCRGQCFTPYSVCKFTARAAACDLGLGLKDKSWISVNDPACGAGALLIAIAQECMCQKINYQTSVLFVAQDIDKTAAMMCFVQLSLLGCPGYIIVGNSLTRPPVGPSPLLPICQDGQEIWYTSMMYHKLWQWRIAVEKVWMLGKQDEPHSS